jgi:anti-anti-sigma factor
MSLTVESRKRPEGGYVVIPKGRLDTNTYLEFEKKVEPYLNGGTKVLVLDMAELEYLSSAGLRAIFKTQKNILAHKGIFLMTRLQPQIERVFEIVKALPKEQVFTSLEEVDAYLDVIQKRELEKRGGGS